MLLTVAELSVVARETIADDDPFALWIVAAASEAVRSAASQPDWTIASAPVRARQIAVHLAARSYLNPDSIQAEGGIGPLGGDRYVEATATALHLTAVERSELEALAPSAAVGGGGLWVQPITPGTPALGGDIYLGTDPASDWMIPYLADDDFPALG